MADPFFSELKYLGSAREDFIEVAVDAGTDVSDLRVTVYKSNGGIRSTSELSGLQPTTVNGKDVYVIESGDGSGFSGVAYNQGVALSENGTVFSFVSFNDTPGTITAATGPAAGMQSTNIGSAGRGSSLETTDGGRSFFTQSVPDAGNITCLTEGTLIETDLGQVPVEQLCDGALVRTFDGTLKPLRRVFKRRVCGKSLRHNQTLYPIRITAGSIAPGLPQQDLVVSRHHRMVVASQIAQRMFYTPQVLVSALRLTVLPGVFHDRTLREVTYFHLLFDAHEVIFANGVATESLFLGTEAIDTLPPEVVAEIEAIFPDLDLPLGRDVAGLPIPPADLQAELIGRHVKNRQYLFQSQ